MKRTRYHAVPAAHGRPTDRQLTKAARPAATNAPARLTTAAVRSWSGPRDCRPEPQCARGRRPRPQLHHNSGQDDGEDDGRLGGGGGYETPCNPRNWKGRKPAPPDSTSSSAS